MARYPKGSGVRPRNKQGKQAQRRVPKEREDYGRRPLDNLDRALHQFVNKPIFYERYTTEGARIGLRKVYRDNDPSADALVYAGVMAINDIKRIRRKSPWLSRLPKAHRETIEYFYAGAVMRDMNTHLNDSLNKENPEYESKFLVPSIPRFTDIVKSSARSEQRAAYHNDIKETYRVLHNGRDPDPVILPQSKRRDGRVILGVEEKPRVPLLEATVVEEDGKPKYKKLPAGREH